MPRLTLALLEELAGQAAEVVLHHGTDLANATNMQQNGLMAASAQALGGSGDFWATDDVAEADWFAQVNPAGGQPACLDFHLPARVLLSLLAAKPPQAELHRDDGVEFFSASFAALNQHMSHKQVTIVP